MPRPSIVHWSTVRRPDDSPSSGAPRPAVLGRRVAGRGPACTIRRVIHRRIHEASVEVRVRSRSSLVVLRRQRAQAEVKTRDKSQVKFEGMLGRMVGMFGGKAAKEGSSRRTPSRAIARSTMNDTTGRIVDLAEEKVYELDFKKKTYTVVTFARAAPADEGSAGEGRSATPTRRRRNRPARTRTRTPKEKSPESGRRLRRQGDRPEEADRRLRRARSRDDDHRAREGQDARGQRRPGR